jgi:succinate-semialdehyde dehydrogenase/glutarate-semialdehyde dehydrogenase
MSGPLSPPPSLSRARIAELTATLRGDGDTTEVRMPFTGQLLALLPTTTLEQVTEAAAEARVAQRAWAATDVEHRTRVLLRWHDAVLDRADELLDVVQAEAGKARGHALEEVADIAHTCRYYARTAGGALAPERRTGVFPVLTRTVVQHHPVGLVGLISPWNYPLTLAIGDAIPALVAGNAVLHKPDSRTTLTTLLARELAVEAGLPPALWQVVVGDGGIVGPAVVEHADHVVFTGSTATGRRVGEQAGRRLVGADLELGGKNAMIICADASLRAAVAGAVRGAFGSAGQLCLSIERIYMAAEVADEFSRRLVAAVRDLTLGAGFDYTHQMGSLAGPAELAKVREHVDDAVAQGAVVLAGGRARPDLGPYFFEPTVLTRVPPHARCFAEETFGPVVSLYPVAGDDEAVTAVNDSRYGLNASVYSRNRARARSIAGRLQAGTVNINEAYAAAWGSVDAPMGGVKDSGFGRRHGVEGLLATTWSQTVATQRLWPVGERGALRGKRYQKAITTALRAFKAARRR